MTKHITPERLNMPRSFEINLNELWNIDLVLENIETNEKDGLCYEKGKNSLFTGVAEHRYQNGKVAYNKSFKNGLLEESKYFYPTGEILLIEELVNNMMKSSSSFHYDGQVAKKEIYENGILVSTTEFDEKGNQISKFNYKGDEMRDISDMPNDLSSSILVKNWLEKGWKGDE